MDHLLTVLQQHDELIRKWGYLLLFGASWLEGLNSMILGGFVASLGKLNIFLVLLVMTLGHGFSGLSWYAIGYFGGAKSLERWGRYIRIDGERLEKARRYFEKHGGKTIIIAKFTIGFCLATLILAGTLKMRLKKFSAYNFLGSAIWACVTAGFGYAFGISFKLLAQYIENFTHLVTLFFLLLGGAIALWYIIEAVLRKPLLGSISEESPRKKTEDAAAENL